MPPTHEMEKIAVELGIAGALALAGWWAGRSLQRDRRVRRLAVYALVAVALAAAVFLLTPVYMQWRGGPNSAPYTTLVVLSVMALSALAVAMLAVAACACALSHCWMTRRGGWLAVLVVASAGPVGLALALFAVNLSHVDPNSSLALGSFLLCPLSVPAVAVYAFVGVRSNGPVMVTVPAGQEREAS